MATVSANVRVAVSGAVGVGPTTVAAPTTANGAVTGIVDLGYVSDNGVTEIRNRSTNKIKAWQNGDVVREVVTEASLAYKCVLIETNPATVALFYGTTVDTATGAVVLVPSSTGGRKSFVIDVIDNDQLIRIYVPEGEITDVGDQVYANGEPIGYEVTITAYPSTKTLDGNGKPGSAKKFYSALKV